MNKFRLALLALLLPAIGLMAQNEDADRHINKGVELHDQGKYKEALAEYEKALAITPEDMGIVYEMAVTHSAMHDLNKAVEMCEKVLATPNDHHKAAYVVLGSSHDDNGEPRKAMAVYKRGLAEFPGYYLLAYNLALTETREKMLEEAEGHLQMALEDNPTHGSSHFLLAGINHDKGQRVKSMLSLYYLALLEPQSERGVGGMIQLQESWGQGVTQNGKSTEIAINEKSLADEEWSSLEMIVSLQSSLDLSKVTGKQTPLERFVTNTQFLFSALGEARENRTSFYWSFYADFFSKLDDAGHTEALVHYFFGKAGNDDAAKWLKKHDEEFNSFVSWLQEYWEAD